MFYLSPQFSWMRGLPLAVAGSSGGLAGILFSVLREAASPVLLAPPDPDLGPLPSFDSSEASASGFALHPPSLFLGLCIGLLLWPVLDLICLTRLLLRRVLAREGEVLRQTGLYRLLA